MIKIIGGFKESESAPLNIIVEYKDCFWKFYQDVNSPIVYGDFIPYKSLEEMEIVPNVEVPDDTKATLLAVLLKNKEAVETNIRSYILGEKFDAVSQEWIKSEN